MDKPTIVCTKQLYPSAERKIQEQARLLYEIAKEPTELAQALKAADGLLCSLDTKITLELLQEADKLKVISNMAVGYNNFDLALMKKKQIYGSHTPYVLDDTTADTVLALLLSVARRICELDRYVKEGLWKSTDYENLYGVDISRTKAGIIGMGRIGEVVAKRCSLGFDMQVSYFNRNRKEEAEEKYHLTYEPIENILQTADFVILMTPLTEQTQGLIGAKELQMMKRNAILINAARGPVVDEKALIHALETGQIRGAGLDVYNQEPIPKEHPLLAFSNVVTTPHIGSATHRTREAMALMAADNVLAGAQGQTPKNLIPEMKSYEGTSFN